jgi:hypothetical protein
MFGLDDFEAVKCLETQRKNHKKDKKKNKRLKGTFFCTFKKSAAKTSGKK